MNFFVRLIIFPVIVFRQLIWPPLRRSVGYGINIGKKTLRNNLVFFSIAFLVLGYYTEEWLDSPQPEEEKTEAEATKIREKVLSIPAFPGVVEDGNSSFAQSIITSMQPHDLEFYTREFNAAMQSAPSNEPYLWKNPVETMFGRITQGIAFRANSGVMCRPFEELIVYNGRGQSFRGVSCQYSGGQGWCRLRPDSARNCDLGYAPGMLERLGRDTHTSYRRFMDMF